MNNRFNPALLIGLLMVANLAQGAEDHGIFNKLQSDDPNYFVAAFPFNGGDVDGDEDHLEFYLSIKYPFNLHGESHWALPDSLPVIYNGLYDFYMIPGNRYDSAPIISRRQNPGVAIEWNLGTNDNLRLSYFHESNGQTLDENDGITTYNTEVSQGGDEYALSQVSRGWDYMGLRLRHEQGDTWQWMMQLELRQYMHRQGFGTAATEDDIFWDPTDDSKIQDYDGLRFTYEQQLPYDFATRLELKTGTSDWRALENFGGKVAFSWKVLEVFYFDGYGKEPSTYHLRSRYAGIGVVFR